MMLKYLGLVLMSLFFWTSCGQLTKKTMFTGEFELKGGKAANKSWDESLIFKRYTWQSEMKTMLDVLVADWPENHPSRAWISDKDQKTIQQCDHLWLMLNYIPSPLFSAVDQVIKENELYEQIRQSGYQVITLMDASRGLIYHPMVEFYLANSAYRSRVICRPALNKIASKQPINSEVPIFVGGIGEQKIKL